MTGGRHQRWKLELQHPFYRPRPRPLLPEEKAANEVVELWVRAAEFRRRANRLLRTHQATLSQWRMGEMVSQLEIARRARMDANTVSVLTFPLGNKGWLSWGPDCYDFAYRIFVTVEGKALLATTRRLLLAAATEIWGMSLREGA